MEENNVKNKFSKLTVYCGSSNGYDEKYLGVAKALGESFLKHDIGLVYGAGDKGMMGKISNTILDGGGDVTGVIPQFMVDLGWVNTRVDNLEVVDDMSKRKQELMGLSDGLIVMPGGIGTMEEFFEALSWSQLKLHFKPIGILNAYHFYDKLIALIDHLIAEGFCDEKTADLIVVDDDPERLLEKMAKWKHHGLTKSFS